MAATQAIAAQQGVAAVKGMSAKTAVGAKAAPMGSAIFASKGLGFGLGLGFWGPVILGIVGGAAVYGYVRSRIAESGQSDEDVKVGKPSGGSARSDGKPAPRTPMPKVDTVPVSG